MMSFNFKNKRLQNQAITISFYILCFIIFYFLDKTDKGGPCAPGLGLLCFLISLPIIFILFMRSLYITIVIDRSNFFSTTIHFLAGMCFFIFLKSL